jgi:hypothetical protein
MSITSTVTVTWRAQQVSKELRAAALRGVRKAAAEAQKDIRAQLTPPPARTGRIYRIRKGKGKRFKLHQASAPGESPARLTGNLIRSVHRKARRTGVDQATGTIEVKADYGLRLEKGIGIRKRPFLDVAMRKHWRKWEGIVSHEVASAGGLFESSTVNIT